MRIVKGGISREIDEKNLQVYRDRGYSVVREEFPEDVEPIRKERPAKKKPAKEKK
jgi:hypothetical protein